MKSNIPSIQKNYAFAILAILLCSALGFTLFVSIKIYEDASQKYLNEQEVLLSKDIRDAETKTLHWHDSLVHQAAAISTSTLYRLFAKDVLASTSSENTSIDKDAISADITSQIPLLRTMLQEFLQHSGFGEGRLLSAEGQELLAPMPDMPPLSAMQRTMVRQAIETGDIAFGLAYFAGGVLRQDFAIPLLPMFQSSTPEPIVAAFFFHVPLTNVIERLTSSEKENPLKSSISILQKNESNYELLQGDEVHPLPQDVQAVWKSFTGETVPLERRLSIKGTEEVFSRGVRLYSPDWWVVIEVPEDMFAEPLKDIAVRISLLGSAVAFGISVCLIFFWWLTVGRSQRQSTKHFKELYHTVQQQNILLNSINLTLRDGLFLVDTKGNILLCNQAFADIVHIDTIEEVIDKKLYVLFKDEGGDRLLAGFSTILREGVNSSFEIHVEEGAATLLYRVNLCSCEGSEIDDIQGVVGTMCDITEFRRQTLANKKMQQNLTNSLVRAIESVDPYMSGHTNMMQSLGLLVVNQLALSKKDAQTIDMATKLSQIGKLCLPRELWYKSTSLTEEEQQQIRQSPIFAREILSGVDFELPIAETIYAMSEKMDGSGWPRGLKDDAIGIHARILAVLNAFCAMVSDRAWREKLDIHKAFSILRQNPAFDQEVVVALETVLKTEIASQIIHPKKDNTHNATI